VNGLVSSRLRPAGRGAFAAPRPTAVVAVASALLLAVSWVHFSHTTTHWDVWWGYGVFFLGSAVAQGLLAVALLRWPGRAVALSGIAVNLAIIVTYIVSRTAGVPFGPHKHVAEPAAVVDVACTTAEIVIVGLLVSLLDGRSRRWVGNGILAIGAVLWALRLTGTML
jgi:hypothetical protein